MAYIGVSPSNGVRQKHTYTATASQTTFSGAGAEGVSLSYRDSNYVDVYRNGVKLGDADYTATSGTSIVLGEGAAVSDIIEIIVYDVFSVADTVSKADGGVFDGNVTMAGTLAVTGETTLSTHLNMGDNDIIKLGDSDDLQIYHDGSSSRIVDTSSGNLKLQGDIFEILNEAGTEQYLNATYNGAVNLFHNNSLKLATTATGIDVTGTVTSDGLILDNAGGINSDVTNLSLTVAGGNADTSGGNITLYGSGSGAGSRIRFRSDSTERMRIENNGDISFYEDTGTTPKLFWDSSVECLNVGTTTSAGKFNVNVSASADYPFRLTNTSSTGYGLLVTAGDGSNALAKFRDYAGNDRVYISGAGNVGIGTNSPADVKLTLFSGGSGTAGQLKLGFDSGSFFQIGRNDIVGAGGGNFQIKPNGGTSIFDITSGGNVGIGTSSPTNPLHIYKTSYPGIRLDDGTAYSSIYNDHNNGSLVYSADDGNARASSNHIFYVDGTEAMRIDSSGNLMVGKTSVSLSTTGIYALSGGATGITRSASTPFAINRLSDDGSLIDFFQDNANEGNISVSGTTVSYNGGHLSRWSQLTDNTRDNAILKGTVMTNLDQMAEWTTDGVTEDNEQLNCMAVSSVEGDANVAGVFVNWDNDDDIYTNDMNIAMTGDMVIRIAQGTTVARGDLLMSAGDGTAKPQGDDIVRSKTIAKVTSTNVSHTYDDGTYLVPCVLMAC